MPAVSASIVIDAPVTDVFGYVDDWANTTKYTHDLVGWEPVGDRTHGLGATFAARMKMGPATQSSTLEITRWEQDAVIGWEPRDGFDQRGGYTFTDLGGRTEVRLELDIRLPGGIAGRVLGKTIEPAARHNVTKTLENLKQILESR